MPKDALGQEINVGEYVIAPDGQHSLVIGIVEKNTPKMSRIRILKDTKYGDKLFKGDILKPHHHLVIVDGARYTMLGLTNS